uniref:Uncharacterized protein n=1 Tax=Arundo donax TaxID=35708 RepID=A0A0A9B4R6_ARUDO
MQCISYKLAGACLRHRPSSSASIST